MRFTIEVEECHGPWRGFREIVFHGVFHGQISVVSVVGCDP